MRAEPIKKELQAKAKELGVDKIVLEFSGGSDEGHLYVQADHGWEANWNTQEELEEHRKKIHKLESDVYEWADDAYEYSGAGDGTPYGDNITYNFAEGKVTTQEWYTVEKTEEECHDTLETR